MSSWLRQSIAIEPRLIHEPSEHTETFTSLRWPFQSPKVATGGVLTRLLSDLRRDNRSNDPSHGSRKGLHNGFHTYSTRQALYVLPVPSAQSDLETRYGCHAIRLAPLGAFQSLVTTTVLRPPAVTDEILYCTHNDRRPLWGLLWG